MAVNSTHNLQVILQKIYDQAELETAYHSRIHQGDTMNQEIIITKDDYPLIHHFCQEGAGLIASAANYITGTSQSGLQAISNPFNEANPNPYDEEDIKDLRESMKQTGEYLPLGEMDTLQFSVIQMEGVNPEDYTITQGWIRSALIHYILHKWFLMNKIYDAAQDNFVKFEQFKNMVRTSALSNQKTIRAKRPYQPIG